MFPGSSSPMKSQKRDNALAESVFWFNLTSGVAIQFYFVFSQFGFTHEKRNALAKCVQIVKCQLNVIFQVWHSNKALWKLVVICWELKEKISEKVLRGFISGDFYGLTGTDCFPTYAISPGVLQWCDPPSFHVFDCVICWPKSAPSLIQRWPFFTDNMEVTLLWSCLVSSVTQSFPCLPPNSVWTLCQLVPV